MKSHKLRITRQQWEGRRHTRDPCHASTAHRPVEKKFDNRLRLSETAPAIKLGRTDTTNDLSHNGKGSWGAKAPRRLGGMEEGLYSFERMEEWEQWVIWDVCGVWLFMGGFAVSHTGPVLPGAEELTQQQASPAPFSSSHVSYCQWKRCFWSPK